MEPNWTDDEGFGWSQLPLPLIICLPTPHVRLEGHGLWNHEGVSDHSSDFDARRIGWWQRRTTAHRIKQSSALMPADRELRMQLVRAAQTRGELNALMRGLETVAPAATAWVPPPSAPYVPPRAAPPNRAAYTAPPNPVADMASADTRPPQAARYPQPQYPQQPPARKKSIRGPVVLGLIIALVTCGGGLVSCVSSVVDSVRDETSGTSAASVPDLGTEAGWSEMVDAFSQRTDLAETVGLLVRDRSATLSVASSDATQSERLYYDGDVTSASEVSREPSERVFDLAQIDPSVPVEAVARARRSSGEAGSTEAWVQVWATPEGPRVLVAFPSGTADTYSLTVDADGTVISERS
ncbi:MAG: hypothetical protein JWR55_2748 [Aeromicrobium sp.]|nr:hypothetical protein [Aeromicrobium sp.]